MRAPTLGKTQGSLSQIGPSFPAGLREQKALKWHFFSGACFASADTVKTDDMPNKMATLQLHY